MLHSPYTGYQSSIQWRNNVKLYIQLAYCNHLVDKANGLCLKRIIY